MSDSVSNLDERSKLSKADSSFLHGVLEIKILSLNYLTPVTWGLGSILPSFVCKDSRNRDNHKHVNGSFLSHFASFGGLANPYIDVTVSSNESSSETLIARTQSRKNTLNPNYYERFSVDLCSNTKYLKLIVKDKTGHNDYFLGELCLTAEDILTQCCSRTGLEGKFPLTNKLSLDDVSTDFDRYASKWMKVRNENRVKYGKRGGRGLGWMNVQIRFTNVKDDLRFLDRLNNQIIESYLFDDKDSRQNFYFTTEADSILKYPSDISVQNARMVLHESYFPPRFNESFQIYIGSHQPGLVSILPKIEIDKDRGMHYKASSCYYDISKALRKAKQFICISMSTFDYNFKLIQKGPGSSKEIAIGELLKKLAKEKVHVLLLLNKNSLNEAAKKFFKKSKVHCALVQRERIKHGMKTKFIPWLPMSSDIVSSHENGFIICDAPTNTGIKLKVRKYREKPPKVKGLVCFLGGINFNQPEYSDPDKLINFERSPVHNVFARVESKGAVDCLQAFVEHWKRQCKVGPLKTLMYRLKGSIAESKLRKILKSTSLQPICLKTKYSVVDEELVGQNSQSDRESNSSEFNLDDTLVREDSVVSQDNVLSSPCSIQIVRSTNSDSAKFNRGITFPNIKFEAGLKVDNSFERAIIHMIRVSERFIYIETNSLISSLEGWKQGSNSENEENISNLGIKNIVVKEMIAKIESKMAVGEDFHVYLTVCMDSAEMDDSVNRRKQTIEYIFKQLAGISTKFNVSLDDYLTVLSLMKVEKNGDGIETSLIKVQSNIVVVDDISCFIGSGSFSQDTMDGSLNTPLGVICSDYSATRRTYVKAFRVALWADHIGAGDMLNDFSSENVEFPGMKECSTYVRNLALQNLLYCVSGRSIHTDNESQSTSAHLILFPFTYDSDNKKLVKVSEVSNSPLNNFMHWL